MYRPCETEFEALENEQEIVTHICRDGKVDTAGCVSKLTFDCSHNKQQMGCLYKKILTKSETDFSDFSTLRLTP